MGSVESNGHGRASEVESKAVERWAGIAGPWQFDGGSATFRGGSALLKRIAEGTNGPPLGLAVCDVPFRDGVIRTNVSFQPRENTSGGLLLNYESLDAPYFTATVGGYDRAYSVSEYQPGRGWTALAHAGHWSNLEGQPDFSVEVAVQGQSLTLAVGGIRVLNVTLPRPIRSTGTGLFAWGSTDIAFRGTSVASSKPRLFVIMPFSEPFETLYREVIRPVAKEENLDFAINRVDEIQAPGIILDDIQRQIAESHAVIAEISSSNPNVFYELGYAHALGKPAILLLRREDAAKMPFDIRGYRAIFYDDTIGGKRQVERLLRQHLAAVAGRGERIEAAS